MAAAKETETGTAADRRLTGGCQCGRVRFRAEALGRASICHCRMCQKAFGGFFGPLVTVHGLVWTKAEPARFRSSNKVRRGFCPACGTPLTFEVDGVVAIDVAIGAFDDPEVAAPVIQVGNDGRLSYVVGLAALPVPDADEAARFAGHYAGIVSFQHPDHPLADEEGRP
jgi:hypothetical protein